MIRQIKRNMLKKALGTNRITLEWRRLQVEKFGNLKQYEAMRNEKRKRKRGKK